MLSPLRSALLLTAAVLRFGSTAEAAAVRPNILFCIADDASFRHLSANGCTWIHTPGFDRVAQSGLRFTRAYTPNAKCAPSRASILTGRNSWQLEEAGNHWCFFPNKFGTFFEALERSGYRTGFTGKPWGPGIVLPRGDQPRFLVGQPFNDLTCVPPTSEISPIDYAANFAAFLRSQPKGKPFCFWYGGKEPHRPYEFGSGAAKGNMSLASISSIPAFWPDDAAVRNDLLDYGFEIEYFDRQLERMIHLLEAAGELDNTVIVVTSDNGMPFPRAKGQEYEIANHMPLAIMWPHGIDHPGRTIDDYVSFIDLAPTLLEVAGAEPSAGAMQPIQGRSLVPIFRSSAAGRVEAGRDHVLLGREREDIGRPNDEGYPIRGIIKDGWVYLHNFEPSRWPAGDPITGYLDTDGSPTKTLILAQNRRGIDHWRWEADFGLRPAEELYELAADPDCLNNRAGAPECAPRQQALRAQLFAELTQQADPRMEGRGAVFDHYVYGYEQIRDFYHRVIELGQPIPPDTWTWVNRGDFEAKGFDPAHPFPTPTSPTH